MEALYGRSCRSPIRWVEVGERRLIRPTLVKETIEAVQRTQERLHVARSQQKSYVDNRQWDLEFAVVNHVYLWFSMTKGVMRFGKSSKLNPWFMRPFVSGVQIGPSYSVVGYA